MLCLLYTLIAMGQSPIPQSTKASPEVHAKLLADFLSDKNRSIPQEDKPYIRCFSWYNYANNPDLAARLKTQRFWVNCLHFESDVEFPKEVPGSDGMLFWFDFRDYGWNAAAWAAVAQREPYFREPAVSAGPAQFIRAVIGATQDPKTFHVEGIVRGDWFIRETCELDRSPSYYDLLFAKQRHPRGREEFEDKTVDHPGGFLAYSGKDLPAGKWIVKVKKTNTGAKFVDFPKTEQDIEKVIGVDATFKYIKEVGINLQYGAVVEGAEKGESIVARQNRLIQRTLGPLGYYYKTFDVRKTAGRRDFAETLQKDFEHDAGENLFKLPAGGQAGFLVNGKGDLLNVADNRFAHDSSDLRLDTRVRTYGSCQICHESGIINPKNLIAEMLKAGVDIKFRDKREARDARSFFTQLEAKLVTEQAEYAAFIKRTSGYAPAENSRAFKAARDAYDAPVDAAKAAAEFGVSVQVLRSAAATSVKARVLNLVQGISMPRSTFEEDGYPELVKLLNVRKP